MARRTKALSPGTAFERETEAICAAYLQAGLAKIAKVDPPSRTISRGGFTRTIFLPSPYLDFVGTVMPSGRCIMLECKTTVDPRLNIRSDTDGGGVSAEQLDNARRWMEAGACVAFLWKHAGAVRILTIEMLEAEAQDRKSIRWEKAHRLFASDLVPFDFLAAVRALYGIN